jgi:hypothetical protein
MIDVDVKVRIVTSHSLYKSDSRLRCPDDLEIECDDRKSGFVLHRLAPEGREYDVHSQAPAPVQWPATFFLYAFDDRLANQFAGGNI